MALLRSSSADRMNMQQDNTIQYGSIGFNESDCFDIEALSLLHHGNYDCSICLERLEDPVWCGKGNCTMRTCRKCFIMWFEGNTCKCPHCQKLISKSDIKGDDNLRIKLEEEEKQYPHSVKKLKEQSLIISMQQKHILMMTRRIDALANSQVRIQMEKMVAGYVSCLLIVLWFCTFWSIFHHNNCFLR